MTITTTTGKALLSLTFLLSTVRGFSFSHNAPTKCDPFTLSWSGGIAPFSMLLAPIFDNPRNFSVPASASGSYSTPLHIDAGKQFVVTLSDATGFASGGVSELLTVGDSISKASCDTRVPTPAFQFELNSDLRQCGSYTISGFEDAIQPVTITGLIPLGTPIQLNSASGQTKFIWDPVNVPTGTSIVFFLTDAAGRLGGSSHLNRVGDSPNSACLDSQSPMSTATAGFTTILDPTSTASTHSGTASSSSPHGAPTREAAAPSHRRTGPGTIAAAVVGVLVAFLVVGSLLVFWVKQYYQRRDSRRFTNHRMGGDTSPPDGFNGPHSAHLEQTPPAPTPWTTFNSTPGSSYISEPRMHQPGSETTTYQHTLENAAYQPHSESPVYQHNSGSEEYRPNPGNLAYQPYSANTSYQPYSRNTAYQPNHGDMAYQASPGSTAYHQPNPWNMTNQPNPAGVIYNPNPVGVAYQPNRNPSYQSSADGVTQQDTSETTARQPASRGATDLSAAAVAPERPESWTELPYRTPTNSSPTNSSPTKRFPRPPQRSTKLILHTDADEEIELPPQYSDRRLPPQPS